MRRGEGISLRKHVKWRKRHKRALISGLFLGQDGEAWFCSLEGPLSELREQPLAGASFPGRNQPRPEMQVLASHIKHACMTRTPTHDIEVPARRDSHPAHLARIWPRDPDPAPLPSLSIIVLN